MTFKQILSDLGNKVYYPVYFLMGEEPYFIDVITNYIAEKVLAENEKAFNQTIIYGRETDVLSIVSQAKRFPMMSNHQVVIIREAQTVRNIEDLLSYVENPLKSTLLVICYKYKTLDKRKKIAKKLIENGVLFESKKLWDNQVQEWISAFLKEKKYQINPKASLLLTEFLGTDLGKIVNELDKLMLNIPPQTEITTVHIEENIGVSKDFNNFELHKAIGSRDIYKANQIVNHFAANIRNNPLTLTLASLCSFFSKTLSYHYIKDRSRNNVASVLNINPFFVRDYEISAKNYNIGRLVNIISHLREYDAKSKGLGNSTTTDGELLRELMYKILH
ncbi:MAG: DNA polymerase III subunit delta [Bacteroidota bacterium]